MANEFQKLSGQYQRTGKEAVSSILRSAGDYRKSMQEVSFEWAEFSKKSINQAIEAQAQLTKKAFAAYISELSRFAMLGLYGPFTRDGLSEGRGAEETRDPGSANTRRKATSRRNRGNNIRATSGRASPRTATQHASTHKRTGPAKTRKTKS